MSIFIFLTGNKGQEEVLQVVCGRPGEGSHSHQHEERGSAEAVATDVHRARQGRRHRDPQQGLVHEALPAADRRPEIRWLLLQTWAVGAFLKFGKMQVRHDETPPLPHSPESGIEASPPALWRKEGGRREGTLSRAC